jgi:hypothetical protein
MELHAHPYPQDIEIQDACRRISQMTTRAFVNTYPGFLAQSELDERFGLLTDYMTASAPSPELHGRLTATSVVGMREPTLSCNQLSP